MRLTAASISSSAAGDNRTIQSSAWTMSLPSQTDLPLGRYGGWNVIRANPVGFDAATAYSVCSPPQPNPGLPGFGRFKICRKRASPQPAGGGLGEGVVGMCDGGGDGDYVGEPH